ncbi:hypothetical protein [Paenibacillus sp. FJAT-26967]|uniref:DUF6414 family protein n=1 Tax=Paenibacillus sp. FJAT-26967 TaxID=1729690 RepID=UPI0008385E75|nr:hypothetical protein [Paenibacillus sp. FJAT-26967]
MKEIVYLDTSFLHSFMAQVNQGLPVNFTREITDQQTSTTTDMKQEESTHDVSGKFSTGSVNIPFLFVTPSGEVTYKYTNKQKIDESYSLSQLDIGKEIISTQLHDNALNDFESYIDSRPDMLCCTDGEYSKYKLGKYIKIKATFSIFDVSYIRKMVNKDIMTKLMSLTEKLNDTPDESLTNDPGIQTAFEAFDFFTSYLQNALPSEVCLKQGKFFSPLKSEFLRNTSEDLIFKYGTSSKIEITVLGKLTREFIDFDLNMFKENGNFRELSTLTNQMMDSFVDEVNLMEKGDIIVSPVAIYFE